MTITPNTRINLAAIVMIISAAFTGLSSFGLIGANPGAPDCAAMIDCVECEDIAPCLKDGNLMSIAAYRMEQAQYVRQEELTRYEKYFDSRFDDLKDDLQDLKQLVRESQ